MLHAKHIAKEVYIICDCVYCGGHTLQRKYKLYVGNALGVQICVRTTHRTEQGRRTLLHAEYVASTCTHVVLLHAASLVAFIHTDICS